VKKEHKTVAGVKSFLGSGAQSKQSGSFWHWKTSGGDQTIQPACLLNPTQKGTCEVVSWLRLKLFERT